MKLNDVAAGITIGAFVLALASLLILAHNRGWFRQILSELK